MCEMLFQKINIKSTLEISKLDIGPTAVTDVTSTSQISHIGTVSYFGAKYRVFFCHWYPPKSSKYKQIYLG